MPPDFVVFVIWHWGSYHNYPKPHCSSENEVESVNFRWTASYWEGKNIALTMKGFMYRKSSWAMLSLKAINCAIKKLTHSLSLFSSFVQGLCLTGVEWKCSGNWVLKKCTFYLSVNVFSTKVLIGDTILRLLIKTGPPFYGVIRATRRSRRLQWKGSTFISQSF